MRQINAYDITGFVDGMLEPLSSIESWAVSMAQENDLEDRLEYLKYIQEAIDEIKERAR